MRHIEEDAWYAVVYTGLNFRGEIKTKNNVGVVGFQAVVEATEVEDV